jgi:methionine-S-sulfoxide reductase
MPKWGSSQSDTMEKNKHYYMLSSLGFDLEPMSKDEILQEASTLLSESKFGSAKSVLLDGKTDTPKVKITNNGFDFSGSVRMEDIESGVFVCAIGGLPLFTTADLSPLTASSGWLSFSKPLADDHVTLIYPDQGSIDQRIEVICSRSGCHLGHYFGKGEGFCINASALNFFPCDRATQNGWNERSNPISWRELSKLYDTLSPSQRIVQQAMFSNISIKEISLGAGCFWHVEYALRRLPGMIDTTVGYSGGVTTSPSYKDVCEGKTNHAEVVLCKFDPTVLYPRKLIDCFLAMHDPTNVRSHGKRAQKSGQYRSCIFVYEEELESMANAALCDCTKQLNKLLCTEVKLHSSKDSFWVAESRHQRHDERIKSPTDDNLITLTFTKWLLEYGRRSSSIWGSSDSMNMNVSLDDGSDDGMAQIMI